MSSQPHTYFGMPEAQKVMRLIETNSPASLGELQRFAIECGLATMETDVTSTVQRMRRAADAVLAQSKVALAGTASIQST